MSTFYKPGELKEHLWKQRDLRYDIDRDEVVRRRSNMFYHPIDPHAAA